MLKYGLFDDVFWASVPDVRLSAAGAGDLVLGEVSVVRRGDEVVSQRAAHVLVDSGVVGINQIVLPGQHVHGESILGHEVVLLSCNKRQRVLRIFGLSYANCSEFHKWVKTACIRLWYKEGQKVNTNHSFDSVTQIELNSLNIVKIILNQMYHLLVKIMFYLKQENVTFQRTHFIFFLLIIKI